MPLNPDAVGSKGEPAEESWTSKDAILYALGVGAGVDELAFTTENTMNTPQRVLPTMGVVLGGGALASVMGKIGTFNPAMLVHGEQSIELAGELPVNGKLRTVAEITGVYDKGKGGVVVIETTSTDPDTGDLRFTKRFSAFIRGEGGWGGDRGPAGPDPVPSDRDPDHTVTYTTRQDQALLYRLSGDRNPLHSDPAFAAMGGFDRPILHGLCTYGFTGRGLLHEICGGDPARFVRMDGRFSAPVFPGEDLTVKMWDDGSGDDGRSRVRFQTSGSDGRVVLDAGIFEHR